jgi:hypothetical protein
MYEIVVLKGADGYFSVSIVNNFSEEEKEVWEENGDKIIARYPLEGSLQALGILVMGCLDDPDSFGSQMEELLTKIVSDIYAKKGGDADV